MSKKSILNAASTIFAGLYASGQVNSKNDGEAKKYAFATALQFSEAADKKSLKGMTFLVGGEVPFLT